MGLLQRIAGLFGRQKSGSMSIEEWFDAYGGHQRTAAGLNVTQVSSLGVSTVMACVSIIAEDIAKLPVHVYRRKSNGGQVVASDHPLEALLRRPNEWQTRFEYIEQLVVALLLRGNAYSPVVRDGRGRPVRLVPVNPDRVWIYEAKDGSYLYMVARRGPHDIAALESLPLMVPSDDMFHIKWMALENSLWGVSRIGLAKEVISLSMAQQELASRLAGHNTNLGGILTTDQKLTDDVIERLKKNWKDNHSGLRNTGSTAVLEQGLKWQPLGMTAQAAEFLASRKFSVEEIARIYRVPLYKLQVSEKATGSTLVESNQDYLNSTLSSYCERITAKLEQHFDIDGDELFVQFDYSHFLKADINTRLNAMRTGVIGMIYTPNEARAAEGLPEVDGGDTLYQPTNVAPIGFTPMQPGGLGSDQTGEPAPGGDGDPSAAPPDGDPGAPTVSMRPSVTKHSPVVVNLRVDARTPTSKRIETTRDAAGNLQAKVIETDG